MAHDICVVGQPDVLVFIVNTITIVFVLGRGVVVDDESSLDVDLDGAWVGDSLFQAANDSMVFRARLGVAPAGAGGILGRRGASRSRHHGLLRVCMLIEDRSKEISSSLAEPPKTAFL